MHAERCPVVESLTSDAWNDLLKQFDDANYRQLTAYSVAAAARVGAESENVAICEGGELLGLCNVRIRQLPLLKFGIAYVNGAPLVQKTGNDVDAATVLMRCLRALCKEFVETRGCVLRVVWVARADVATEAVDRTFLECGFKLSASKGYYRTVLVDLTRDLPVIRRTLDQKWRNILNKAERQKMDIVRGTEPALFEEFAALHADLVVRKKLNVDLNPEFFLKLQAGLPAAERFVVHLARQDGQVLAGHLGAFHGDTAVYLLGAANEAGLKTNASYVLQWRVMEYAKQRACRWYDLGGIDPVGNPGVYRFKTRIGGADICAPGPYEVGTPARRALVRILEALYRMVRR